MCFWRKKQQNPQTVRSESGNKTNPARQQATGSSGSLECLICGAKFEPEEIVFGLDCSVENASDLDMTYDNYITKNFNNSVSDYKKVYRKFKKDWEQNDVKKWETITDKDGRTIKIPLTLQHVDFVSESQSSDSRGADAETDNLEATGLKGDSDQQTSVEEKTKGIIEDKNSTCRLCPKCHCELTEGMLDKKRIIRIGFYGGKRSGKTTYIAVAAKSLSRLSELGLADVTCVTDTVLDKLYKKVTRINGADPTVSKDGLPCFPIIMRVKPNDKSNDPFFLILQDVPGEEAIVKNPNLVNNPYFTKSDAFIGIVDINMLYRTEEAGKLRQLRNKENNEIPLNNEEKAELDRLDKGICVLDPDEVFGDFKFASFMENLKSVQLVLAKFDQWIEQDKKIGEDSKNRYDLELLSELSEDHTTDHKGAIDVTHLELADTRLRELLCKAAPKWVPSDENNEQKVDSKSNSTYLDKVIRNLNLSDTDTDKAFLAVSSRWSEKLGSDSIFDPKEHTLNILDPILNVCRWEKVLPAKEKESRHQGDNKRN